jgi:hypothetical protein
MATKIIINTYVDFDKNDQPKHGFDIYVGSVKAPPPMGNGT